MTCTYHFAYLFSFNFNTLLSSFILIFSPYSHHILTIYLGTHQGSKNHPSNTETDNGVRFSQGNEMSSNEILRSVRPSIREKRPKECYR